MGATPRAGSRLLLATTTPNFFFNLPNSKNNCQDGRVQDQTELPRGLRGVDQQADQHGILCLVRLSLHELLLQPGRPSTKPREEEGSSSRTSPSPPPWIGGLRLKPWKLRLSSRSCAVNQSLLDLHKVAGDKGDGHLCDFLESEYLAEQVEGIKAIGDLIVKMKRAGDGLGLYLIDKEMGS